MASSPGPFKIDEYVLHHVTDGQKWQLPFLPAITLPEPLSLHGLMVILAAVFLIVLFCFIYRHKDRVPRGITNALEACVVFIRDEIAIPSMGQEDGRKFTPLLCTLFFFILTLNLMGLVPIFAAATANTGVTAALALIVLYHMSIGTIKKNGLGGFFHAFIPSGVPVLILPLIFLLEFLGMFIKVFALTVRLFANMLAGHMVIYTLLGLVVMFGVWGAPAVLLALGIKMLEVLVVFLQAYIFVLLSAVFIGQMQHPEH